MRCRIPLEDIYPPPANPHVDLDNRTPSEDGGTTVWLCIDGRPMQTAEGGETLRFGLLNAGLAQLAGARARTWRGSVVKRV